MTSMTDSDNRSSLRHILADETTVIPTISRSVETSPTSQPTTNPPVSTNHPTLASTEDDELDVDTEVKETDPNNDPGSSQFTSIAHTIRRNANGSVSSVFAGNKIRHLKKDDGIPLWRKDIQFEFLQAIFDNDQRVFTLTSDMSPGHTFTEIYVDSLANSSKTSKILKEKLLQDHESALTTAMVCLLVNIGRMNTTLNFFPEMRAQLRTYHSIPALQAHQDPHAYKQLQDAPRLKSILKGASEDEPQPGTMEQLRASPRPRTNSVNLVFLLAQYAPKVTEMHFNSPRDFFDLVMRPTLSSKSRARAFLWLIWWYLESDLTQEDSQRNPFGRGEAGEGTDGLSIKVPSLEVLTEEQAALENVDTEQELAFGDAKQRERSAIVASEPSPAMTALKRARKDRTTLTAGHLASDREGSQTPGRDMESPAPTGSIRRNVSRGYDSDENSPSPEATLMSSTAHGAKPKGLGLQDIGTNGSYTPSRASSVNPGRSKASGPGRGNWRKNKLIPTISHVQDKADPQLPSAPNSPTSQRRASSLLPAILNERSTQRTSLGNTNNSQSTNSKSSKIQRPLTSHQIAISEYRRNRINRVLERAIQKGQVDAYDARSEESSVLRAWKRIKSLPSGYDSEEESIRGTTAQVNSEKKDNAGSEESKYTESTDFDRMNPVISSVDNMGSDKLHQQAGNIQRPRISVWMGGFAVPGAAELDDFGEEYGHYSRIFGELTSLAKELDSTRLAATFGLRPRKFFRRKSLIESFRSEIEQNDDEDEKVDRPRLARKSVAENGQGSAVKKRGSNNSSNKKKRSGVDKMKVEDGAQMNDAKNEEVERDDGMDVDDTTILATTDAENVDLDDEDKELLGEVDAGDSEEDGNGDEDAVDDGRDEDENSPEDVRNSTVRHENNNDNHDEDAMDED